MTDLSHILNNARFLELTQVYLLMVRKLGNDVGFNHISSKLRKLDEPTKEVIELIIVDNIRKLMNDCKNSFEDYFRDKDLSIFTDIDKNLVNQRLIENLKHDEGCLRIVENLINGGTILTENEIQRRKSEVQEEIRQLKQKLSDLEEENQRINSAILDGRMKLIAKFNN